MKKRKEKIEMLTGWISLYMSGSISVILSVPYNEQLIKWKVNNHIVTICVTKHSSNLAWHKTVQPEWKHMHAVQQPCILEYTKV